MDEREQTYAVVSKLFESLGRALVCLDGDFRVVHVSDGLDRLWDAGAAEALVGVAAHEILGGRLFGPEGTLRRALAAGERREGWGATLQAPGMQPRQVSLSCAPIDYGDPPVCEPHAKYVVVVRPRADAVQTSGNAPTLFAGMLARSAGMLRMFDLIEKLEESQATVLIEGESGTGKELVARAIHMHSPRRSGPFIAINCAALPGELLESELFGHVRGAFTGAYRDRKGRFELAVGGTLFLDEVGEIPLHLQSKLLRVLQERTFEPIGAARTLTSDARIIAATNRDLRRAVIEGQFRDDLYYRLRVVPMTIPPLRERREDIEPLAHHLFGLIAARHHRSLILGPELLRAFLDYSWPGNVREMENALEFAVAVCHSQTVQLADLPPEMFGGDGRRTDPPPAAGEGDPERERFRRALDEHRWHREATARALGISRSTLWRRMRELGLDG